MTTLLATRAWLRPVSRGNRHFTVGGGRLRQSGPRPDTRLLRQLALEGLTRSARTDSPRRVGRNNFRRTAAAAAATSGGGGGGFVRGGRRRLELGLGKSHFQNPPQVLNTLSSVSVRESRIQYLCDQWFRDTASRGSTTIVAPGSWLAYNSIGYTRMSASGESSTTMHRLLHASGSHPILPPNDPKTTQYNQDLGLIHSTNGNHLESPNEGSSIDHQVTIYLHAQNITMCPTNETWYFASQILVSSSGCLILILTAQSTRNMFRMHSDY
ncbi:small conductance mechanosensitive ion channel family [Dorcoceras hygrometricum]|uniref:Small conductance mechanosensitive ion channel family n=1 Tax=Dorcoceras hygrometricum TaxID=472368 RepID=A0A2Z7CT50_9LAMI|nr:small conductance mechanosensitive ion channel family [Dorcoceras hygrometricum]